MNKNIYIIGSSNHNIVKTIHMETEWDPSDPIGETKWIQKLYEMTGFPNALVAQAWFDRDDIEKELGSPLPPLGEPLPPDVEKRLSDLVAQAAEKLSLRKQAEMQQQKAMEQMQDPIIQQRNRELDIQEGELMRKAEADRAKASINQQKIKSDVLTHFAENSLLFGAFPAPAELVI